MKFNLKTLTLEFSFPSIGKEKIKSLTEQLMPNILLTVLTVISIISFYFYYNNHLGIAYNDARSHLDIGRRVVEGLKPGFAQLGSVWLPLPHLLMVLTIWNDFMWHSGLAGALQSMVSFIFTGVIIYRFVGKLGGNLIARILAVIIFVANINILYMQSTAMTELLLLGTMTAGMYELFLWHDDDKHELLHLIKSSFWIMLSTLVRYDGWFLFLYAIILVVVYTYKKLGIKAAEGKFLFFSLLAGFGIFLWFLWNLVIFKDPLYFAFGPYSAHAQQDQLQHAGVLATKKNLLFSAKVYLYALAYNSGTFTLFLGLCGGILLWFDKRIKLSLRIASTVLFSPLLFNIIALYMGHSVLFIQGLSGNTWFNVRYGLVMMPSIAIFIGYLFQRLKPLRFTIIALLIFVTFFSFVNGDAVTIDDARVGSSQKNVSEVSGWLYAHTKDKEGFVLISAASHDAIIFSSGLPMSKFIHEGTGGYWEAATTSPDRWARWIVMRTNDLNDQTFKFISKTAGFKKYKLVDHYPFADIYEIKPEYMKQLNTKPTLGKQK